MSNKFIPTKQDIIFVSIDLETAIKNCEPQVRFRMILVSEFSNKKLT